MKIVYLPGFLSQPKQDNPKVKFLESLGHEVLVADTHGEYTLAAYYAAVFGAGEKILKAPLSEYVFVGTSLGGFWSRVMGYLTLSPWIALNPSVFPSEDLRPWLGEQTLFGLEQKFVLTEQHLEQYKALEQNIPLVSRTRALVIVAEDDDILTSRVDAIQDIQIEKIPRGGHRLENVSDYGDLIKEFLAHCL